MTQSSIFKSIHAMLDETKLIPLIYMDDEQLEQFGTSHTSLNTISERLDINIDQLYYDQDNTLQPICYWDGLFYYAFIVLDERVIFNQSEDTQFDCYIEKQFKHMRNALYAAVENNNWSGALQYADKKSSFLVFENLRDRIPAEQQKELFLSAYTRNEYGFDRLDPQMVRDVLNLPTPDEYDIKQADIPLPASGIIRIYRGVTPASSPLHKAYSWTLSLKTAEFFANRFDSDGKVVKAYVHIDNVKAYMSGRGENEALVLPEDILYKAENTFIRRTFEENQNHSK